MLWHLPKTSPPLGKVAGYATSDASLGKNATADQGGLEQLGKLFLLISRRRGRVTPLCRGGAGALFS